MRSLLQTLVLLGACALHAHADNIVFDDGPGLGRRFDGIGGLSGGGATSKLLVNYPPKLRDEILDFLFKPNFGASLQILKCEIGGDAQTTDGTEASHMHNKWEENYNRGYEWWLMKEAKKRNNKIKLYALPWAFPGWIGEGTNNAYANNTQTADYIVRWINGAKEVHGLTIDYVGLHNEGSWNVNYTIILRNMLDSRGFENVQIVAADGFGWSWSPATDIMNDPAFAKAVFAVGAHYTGTYSSPDAKACGAPLWSSEDWSTFNDGVGGGCWARLLNQNYVNGLMTSTIAWNLIASYYENLPYDRTGLMTALEPWSGNYVVSTPIWVSAHTTQFTQPGWYYLEHGAGVGRLAGGGSYVAFIAQNSNPWGRQDMSIVFETMSHDHSVCKRPHMPAYTVTPQTVTLELRGAFRVLKSMNVWKSKIGFNGAADEMFIKQAPVNVTDGKITLNLGVDEIWTLTTLTTGTKGSYPDPPASKPFILPYTDDMEAYDLYMEPYNLAQQMGTFEILADPSVEGEVDAGNKFARQMSLMRPVHWSGADTADKALNVIGTNWTEGFIEVDFRLPSVNSTKGVFVAMRVDKGGGNAAAAWGVYFHAFSNKFIVTNDLAGNHTLSQGFIQYKNMEWHKLSLLVQNNVATGAFDGKSMFNVTLPPQTPKAGWAAIGTDSYGLADFDNLKLDTKASGLRVMQEYKDNKDSNRQNPKFTSI